VVDDAVATIVREVESLRVLVDEFSRYGRLPEVDPRPGDLREVAEAAVALYEGAAAGIRLRTEFAADLPPHRVDREAMRRVLINLLDNAVGALDGGGSIVVRVSHHPAHHRIVLEVSDDGPGLPVADRDKLFLPTFSRRAGGTGLGLAIAHRIVSEHGGTIRAEPNAPCGTRMIVELPAQSAVESGDREGGTHT
jgi:signal transduction histidine kinase